MFMLDNPIAGVEDRRFTNQMRRVNRDVGIKKSHVLLGAKWRRHLSFSVDLWIAAGY